MAALGGEDVGVAGVRVAPTDVAADRSRERGMITVVAVRNDELAPSGGAPRDQMQEVRAGRSYEARTAVAAAILTAGSFTCAARNSGSRAITI